MGVCPFLPHCLAIFPGSETYLVASMLSSLYFSYFYHYVLLEWLILLVLEAVKNYTEEMVELLTAVVSGVESMLSQPHPCGQSLMEMVRTAAAVSMLPGGTRGTRGEPRTRSAPKGYSPALCLL